MKALSLSLGLILFCLAVEELRVCSGADPVDIEAVVRTARVAQLRRMMLDQLGWNEVPSRWDTSTETPDAVMEEYNLLTTLQRPQPRYPSTLGAPAVLGLKSFKGNISKLHSTCGSSGILEESYKAKFTLQWPKGKDIEKVELFLHQTPTAHINGSSSETHATVQISDATLADEISFAVIPLCTKAVRMAPEQSQRVFDITGNNGAWLVGHIRGNETAEVQLTVTVYRKCSDGSFGLTTDSATNTTDSTRTPRLVITFKHSDTGNMKLRRKRMEEELPEEQQQVTQYCTANNSECCLHNITVDFHRDLEFDFITSPLTYNFRYCGGVCKPWYNERLQTPGVYAILSAFYNSNQETLLPCCTPSAYESLHVITNIVGSEHITFNNAIVTDCQCS